MLQISIQCHPERSEGSVTNVTGGNPVGEIPLGAVSLPFTEEVQQQILRRCTPQNDSPK
jgi:hypothetical protein